LNLSSLSKCNLMVHINLSGEKTLHVELGTERYLCHNFRRYYRYVTSKDELPGGTVFTPHFVFLLLIRLAYKNGVTYIGKLHTFLTSDPSVPLDHETFLEST
jgi:hypothetical protein